MSPIGDEFSITPGMDLQKPDILRIIEDQGIILKRRGKSYWCSCPFHEDNSPSFQVSPEKQSFHCFGCAATGDVIAFVMKLRSFSFIESLRFLGISSDGRAPATVDSSQVRRRELVKLFRQWEKKEYEDLASLVRIYRELIEAIKTSDDIESCAFIFDDLPMAEHELDILQFGSDEEKFSLWKSRKLCGKVNV